MPGDTQARVLAACGCTLLAQHVLQLTPALAMLCSAASVVLPFQVAASSRGRGSVARALRNNTTCAGGEEQKIECCVTELGIGIVRSQPVQGEGALLNNATRTRNMQQHLHKLCQNSEAVQAMGLSNRHGHPHTINPRTSLYLRHTHGKAR